MTLPFYGMSKKVHNFTHTQAIETQTACCKVMNTSFTPATAKLSFKVQGYLACLARLWELKNNAIRNCSYQMHTLVKNMCS